MVVGSYAPTVVNFQLLMNTDIQALGFALVPGACFTCLGSLMGGVAVDKINPELFFGTAVLIIATCISLKPWAPNIYVFAVILAVRYASSSAINAGEFVQSESTKDKDDANLSKALDNTLHNIQ